MANTINSLTIGGQTGVFSLPYGVCSTAAATAAKTVTVDNFSLETGATIIVKFTYANTAETAPTLNVNGTGAIALCRYGTTALSTGTTTTGWYAGSVQLLVYDGTSWIRDYWNNSTYSNASLGNGYATCSTAAGTVAKTASLSSYALSTGGMVSVRFTNGNTVASPTLNVNSKGAKAIYFNNAALTDTTLIKAGDVVTMVYSTYYHIVAINGSVVTSGSYGQSADASPSHGGTFSVPYITVDKTGRVTAASTKTITLPTVTTYTFGTGDNNGTIKVTPSGGSASNIAVKGLGTAAYTDSTAYAASSHTHPYLSTDGGTLSGNLKISKANSPTLELATTSSNGYTAISQHGGTLSINSGMASGGDAIYLELRASDNLSSAIMFRKKISGVYTDYKLYGEHNKPTPADIGAAASSHNHAATEITSGTLAAARLPSSGVTAGSYGQSAAASPAHGKTFTVPYITVDAYGRVTAASNSTITLPAASSGSGAAGGVCEFNSGAITITSSNTSGYTNSSDSDSNWYWIWVIHTTDNRAFPFHVDWKALTTSQQWIEVNVGLSTNIKIAVKKDSNNRLVVYSGNNYTTIKRVCGYY